MNSELTYMDCWNFIAPLIPVNTDYTMGRFLLTRNEANYIADIAQIIRDSERRQDNGREKSSAKRILP